MSSQTGESLAFWTTKRSGTTFWLLAVLSFCSFVATAWGTFELIQSSFLGDRTFGEFRLIDYPVIAFAASLLAVVQLVLIFTVKVCYSRHASLIMRLVAFFGYLACLCITAGFGFGFWWKLFVANTETLASTRTAVESVGADLNRAAGRLDGLKLALDGLKEYSEKRSIEEATRGNTCGTSQGVPGPRQRLRKGDAAKFESVAVYVTKQLTDVRTNIDNLQKLFGKLVSNDPSIVAGSGTRSAFIEGLSYQQSLAVNSFNNLTTDPILLSARQEFGVRARQTEFAENAVRFSCPDSELSAQLNRIISSIDALAATKLVTKKITVTEGPKAVAYALSRLWNTVSAFVSRCHIVDLGSCQLPLSSAEIRDLSRSDAQSTGRMTEGAAGLGREDILPLGFGIVVDVLILLFGYFRFRGSAIPINTRDFVTRIDSCFRQVFDRLPTPSERLLPIKATVFDRWSGHYAAVPVDFRDYRSVRSSTRNVPRWANRPDASSPNEGEEEGRAPTMQEAQYLDNVFTALQQAGFVRLLGFWGRLLNLVTEDSARAYLERQNSFFANAPSLKIYKFYPDAYSIIMEHFLSSRGRNPERDAEHGWGNNTSDQVGLGRARPMDRFPKGFGHEV
jgi:hypothetical protein